MVFQSRLFCLVSFPSWGSRFTLIVVLSLLLSSDSDLLRQCLVGLQRHSAWDGCSTYANEVKLLPYVQMGITDLPSILAINTSNRNKDSRKAETGRKAPTTRVVLSVMRTRKLRLMKFFREPSLSLPSSAGLLLVGVRV